MSTGPGGPLSDRTRRVVEAAALLGPTFSPTLLARVADVDLATCLEAVDDAVRAGVLALDGPGVAEFVSEELRTELAGSVPLAARVRLHHRAAAALEETGDLAAIADHWAAAAAGGARDEAVAWALRTGDEALDRRAYDDAELAFELAVRTGTPDRPEERLAAAVGAAVATFQRGRLSAAHHHATSAMALARLLGSPAALARAALVLEPIGSPSWDGDVRQWCREALAADPDEPTRARLLARLARAAAYCGDWTDARTTSADALPRAERSGDADVLAEALAARQLAACGPEDVAELTALATRMVELGVAGDRPEAELWGRLWRMDALWYDGRLAEIAAELSPLRRCVARIGTPYARWNLLVARAALAAARAELVDAERLVAEAVEVFRSIDHPAAHGAAVSLRLVIGHHRGHSEEYLAPATWTFPDETRWDLFAQLGRAAALVDAGRLEDAAASYDRCGAVETWAVPPGALLVVLALAARVATALHRDDDVRYVRDRLLPHRGRYVVGGAGGSACHGPVVLTLGRCAAALGDTATAVAELRLAGERCRESGAPGFRVEADTELATVLRRAGDEDALGIARRAAPLARALGLVPWERRLAALLGADQPLSPRELEVAGLVARGLSNRAIADTLVISERTAENHVQHVLTKLGVANRVQIAAWVAGRAGSTR